MFFSNFVSKIKIMDYISTIIQPIEADLEEFKRRFHNSLAHTNGLLQSALDHIRSRSGKQMRPMLTLLTAKNYGQISDVTHNATVALELLHTASLVHDDVVDESSERRGVPSMNAAYNNKVAVLVGDYVLSTCLLNASIARNHQIMFTLSQLGQTLAAGEILQLQNIESDVLSEDVYYQVIHQKTAALFGACSAIGAMSVDAPENEVEAAKKFGHDIGMIFQIRDDIFDYSNSHEIGKPTGNDMIEGKLTLPAIYALNHTDFEPMKALARKVKARSINLDEIAVLVEFTKRNGGIEYAQQKMDEIARDARRYIEDHVKPELQESFSAYVDFVIQRRS